MSITCHSGIDTNHVSAVTCTREKFQAIDTNTCQSRVIQGLTRITCQQWRAQERKFKRLIRTHVNHVSFRDWHESRVSSNVHKREISSDWYEHMSITCHSAIDTNHVSAVTCTGEKVQTIVTKRQNLMPEAFLRFNANCWKILSWWL